MNIAEYLGFKRSRKPLKEEEKEALRAIGISDHFLESVFSGWFQKSGPLGALDLFSIRDIIEYDWKEHLAKHGLLAIGSCPNGDPVAIGIEEEKNYIVYVSHEDEGLYEEGPPVWEKVSNDLSSFLQDADEQEDFPYDYYDAQERNNT